MRRLINIFPVFRYSLGKVPRVFSLKHLPDGMEFGVYNYALEKNVKRRVSHQLYVYMYFPSNVRLVVPRVAKEYSVLEMHKSLIPGCPDAIVVSDKFLAPGLVDVCSGSRRGSSWGWS